MGSLIGMVVWDAPEHNRTDLTRKTLQSLSKTVNFDKHELMISDNGSGEETLKLYEEAKNWLPFTVIYGKENVGTSRALNKIIAKRKPNQHVCKIDPDVVIHYKDWLDELEDAIERDPLIGICALKRKDLLETPNNPENWYKSELAMLDHKPGQKWIIVEKILSCIGTCTLFNSKLIDTIGYSYQIGKYGFEDSAYSMRCKLAGFYACFLPHINIDHIDHIPSQEYQDWKTKHSSDLFDQYNKLIDQYISGERSIYEGYNE